MAHPPSFTPPSFTTVTYNIRKAIGTDRRRDPMRVLNVLREVDADIIVLQEADRRFGRRSSALPPFMIEQHSDYEPVPLDVQGDSIGWHGNTILVRRGIAVRAHDIVHIPFLEPRGVVTATLELPGEMAGESAGWTVSVFGMHLDLSGLWRARQARAIAQLARGAQREHPVVMMGDLNEWRGTSSAFREFSRGFTMLDCGRSFHSRRPLARLDRVMHGPGLTVLECGVHRSALAVTASDHLPVRARFAFAGD